VAGSCEYGDEPSGSGATELVWSAWALTGYEVVLNCRKFEKHWVRLL
jgi:hypothetical protein